MCSVFMFHAAAMQTHQDMSGGSWMRPVWPLDQQRGGVELGEGGREGGLTFRLCWDAPAVTPFPSPSTGGEGEGGGWDHHFTSFIWGLKPLLRPPPQPGPPLRDGQDGGHTRPHVARLWGIISPRFGGSAPPHASIFLLHQFGSTTGSPPSGWNQLHEVKLGKSIPSV